MKLYQDNTMSETQIQEENKEAQNKSVSWLKRLGFAGFMFFFLKGMGWIVLAVIAWIWGPEAIVEIKNFFANLF
ncbi:MAG: hypothetical protein R2836_02310 [Chitinophagales bacterium]